ncbi:MAG: AAA family ATPase [Candidatus Woesearchaeota archaeon]
MGEKTLLFIENDLYWFKQIESQFMLRPEYKVEHETNMVSAMNNLLSSNNYYTSIILSTNTAMNSIEQAVHNIKEKAPVAYIICVLEQNDPVQIAKLRQMGIQSILTKPYNIELLLKELNNVSTGGVTSNQQSYMNNNGNIHNPSNVKINNLNEMGQNTKPVHDFQQVNPNMQPEPNQQQLNMYQQNNPPYDYQQHNSYSNSSYPPQNGQNPYQQQGGNIPYNNYGTPQNPYGHQISQQPSNGIYRIPKNTTISVYSPKGGVGKSTFSKELAITYAVSSVNGEPLKVCLVDMDIEKGDIGVLLDMRQTKSIADWAKNIMNRKESGEDKLNYTWQEIIDYYLLQHKSGLYVLSGPTNYRDATTVTGDVVTTIVENLKQYFDVVIVDCGNNYQDYTIVSMEMSDRVIVVADTDVHCINDIISFKKTMELTAFDIQKIGLVMNRIKKKYEQEIPRICQEIGFPMIGLISHAGDVESSNNQGESLALGKDTPYTIALKKIANSILPVVQKGRGKKKIIQSKKNKSNNTKSFLDKLLGR